METKQEKPATPFKPPRLAASAALGTLNEIYYRDLANAKQQGRPVVWITSMTPIELVYAFDGIPFFPENYAALCSSRKVAEDLCKAGEARGYSQDLCAYALCTFGVMFEKRGAFGDEGPPAPDILLATQGACMTHPKWWEAMQRHYKCPMIIIDAAYTVDSDTLSPHHREYYASELKETVRLMEKYTNKKLGADKLREVVTFSDQASALWDEIDEMRAAVPTPISQIDVFTCLFALVTLKGTKEAVEFYKQLRDEVKMRVDNKVGFVPNEKFRLVWDMFPIYHNMRLLNYFAEFGAAFVTDLYGNAFSGRLNVADPYGSLADRYLSFFMRAASWGKAELYKKRIKKYHVDGIVFHSNRCCRCFTAEQPDIGNILRDELGLSSLMFEGNMVDPRGYDDTQVKAKIESFIEMLEARKYPKK
ncbi:MAG TPA: 2-hydroxyacyl-CoA dehydratase family protein [Dehalococcoidia bacterium]|nr:2-hydroxyacyl-CoA dehydratase family protein [Dehalococcoidia bacterium]